MRIFLSLFCICTALGIAWYLIKRGHRWGKKRAYCLILLSAVFFTSVFIGESAFFDRLETLWGERPYAAEIASAASSVKIGRNETRVLYLSTRNAGSRAWDSRAPDNPTFLSWHILSASGAMIRFENPRIAFEKVIYPEERTEVAVSISPLKDGLAVGKYLFEFDVIRENVCWFADKGSPVYRMSVEVLP